MAKAGIYESHIVVKGADQLVRGLVAMGTDRKTIAAANRESGLIVLESAKRNAKFKYGAGHKHVYKHQRGTGKLLRSLQVTTRGARVYVKGGGTRVPYANPIHWGWFYDKNNFIKKRIMPNPFLSRALGYNKQEILATYKRNLDKLIAANGK